MIDNYGSMRRNAKIRVAQVTAMSARRVVLSPGQRTCLTVSAETGEDGVAGRRRRVLPIEDARFHLETPFTEHGHRMPENFLRKEPS